MKTVFMRRGQVVAWLTDEVGLTENQVRVLLEAGTIKAIYLPGRAASGRAIYSRAQVQRDVVDPLMVVG